MASRRRRFRRRPKPQLPKPTSNDEISAAEVRLIGPEGEQLGVVPTEEARQRAAETEQDLVVVAGKADPPVVRIMDLGKHMYEKRKKNAKQKSQSKGGDMKGIRIGFKTGQHDWDIRLRKAEGFLEQGHKVKLEMRLRGREKGRTEMASNKMKEFIAELPNAALEGSVSRSGNSISAVVARARK